ncbi:hypothetical protein [Fischerella thermalis]|uniref:hypothetical protein n=1 Tax=Fischerella thermalis TaxID=372787 RepID=UPI000C7F7FB0|nr:hypothetical protein [Fischerella thermalis]PLZ25440.1 hypothetical protein CBP28_15835 [Fischerella thermalis WC559]RDH48053.1 hypothetical protein CA946_17105 [Fischerella thermalis 111/344/542]
MSSLSLPNIFVIVEVRALVLFRPELKFWANSLSPLKWTEIFVESTERRLWLLAREFIPRQDTTKREDLKDVGNDKS